MKIAKYADALSEHMLQVLEPVIMSSYMIREERGSRNIFVATVADQGPWTQQGFCRSTNVHQRQSRNANSKYVWSACLNGSHHCCVCLASVQNMDQYSCTVRSNERAKLRKMNFHKKLNNRHSTSLRPGAFSGSRSWNRSLCPGSPVNAPVFEVGVVQEDQTAQANNRGQCG